jgi:hypothetical protein
MFVLGTGWSSLALMLLGMPPVATGKKTSCPSIDGRGNPVALEPPLVSDPGIPPFGVVESDEDPCSSVVSSGSVFLVGSGISVGSASEAVGSGSVGRPVIVGTGAWKSLSDRNQSIKPSNPKYGVLSGETPRTSRSRLVG